MGREHPFPPLRGRVYKSHAILILSLTFHPLSLHHKLHQTLQQAKPKPQTPPAAMQFSIVAIVAALASFAAASPLPDASPAGVALRRAIDKAYFTEAELADTSKP